MNAQDPLSLIEYFSVLPDPRIDRARAALAH